jgi:hypothetical protein
MTFADIPESVIEYVRQVFAAANDRVSRKMSDHPSMHEESLDHTLIDELTDAPAAFFATEGAAVRIESHWLGGRWMYGRWEIADIALMILLRRNGGLVQRKVALLQTKRLYSKEIAVETLGRDDFDIGIGRLGDRTDPEFPMSQQRAFSFDDDSQYGAISACSDQVGRIEAYVRQRRIPVFYALYNPRQLPWRGEYPALNGARSDEVNAVGCRVQTMAHVHGHLSELAKGQHPTFGDLNEPGDGNENEAGGSASWRLEDFVADEVLRCRQGALFDGSADENLEYLFYRRSAPIQAAIAITIEVGGDG